MNSTERNGSEPPTLGAACSSVTGLQRIPLLAPSHAIGNMSLTQIVKISRFGVNRGQRGHPFSSRNSTHWRSQLPRDLQMVPPLLRRACPNKSGLHNRSCPGGCHMYKLIRRPPRSLSRPPGRTSTSHRWLRLSPTPRLETRVIPSWGPA